RQPQRLCRGVFWCQGQADIGVVDVSKPAVAGLVISAGFLFFADDDIAVGRQMVDGIVTRQADCMGMVARSSVTAAPSTRRSTGSSSRKLGIFMAVAGSATGGAETVGRFYEPLVVRVGAGRAGQPAGRQLLIPHG